MTDAGRLAALALGLLGGMLVAFACLRDGAPARAGDTDHFEDYGLCTGAINVEYFLKERRWSPDAKAFKWSRDPVNIDGIWLLDYRTGRLLATACDKTEGKILGWAEVDLVNEFHVAPRQTVHFAMTTGQVGPGQAALYIMETTTGQMGIYTMAPKADGTSGVIILRHDVSPFRKPKV
jgi:hypothetical protein